MSSSSPSFNANLNPDPYKMVINDKEMTISEKVDEKTQTKIGVITYGGNTYEVKAFNSQNSPLNFDHMQRIAVNIASMLKDMGAFNNDQFESASFDKDHAFVNLSDNTFIKPEKWEEADFNKLIDKTDKVADEIIQPHQEPPAPPSTPPPAPPPLPPKPVDRRPSVPDASSSISTPPPNRPPPPRPPDLPKTENPVGEEAFKAFYKRTPLPPIPPQKQAQTQQTLNSSSNAPSSKPSLPTRPPPTPPSKAKSSLEEAAPKKIPPPPLPPRPLSHTHQTSSQNVKPAKAETPVSQEPAISEESLAKMSDDDVVALLPHAASDEERSLIFARLRSSTPVTPPPLPAHKQAELENLDLNPASPDFIKNMKKFLGTEEGSEAEQPQAPAPPPDAPPIAPPLTPDKKINVTVRPPSPSTKKGENLEEFKKFEATINAMTDVAALKKLMQPGLTDDEAELITNRILTLNRGNVTKLEDEENEEVDW